MIGWAASMGSASSRASGSSALDAGNSPTTNWVRAKSQYSRIPVIRFFSPYTRQYSSCREAPPPRAIGEVASLRRAVATGRRRTLTSAPEVPPRPPTGTRHQTVITAGRSACELVQVGVPVSPPLIAAVLGPSPKDVLGGLRKLSGCPSFGGLSDLCCPPGIPSFHLPRKKRGERGRLEHPSPRWRRR